MEKYLSLYQGFGITFSLIFQDYTPLQRRYGKKAETILKNADMKRYLVFNADDVEFGKRVSQALGTITVESKSKSQSNSTSNRSAGASHNHSTSTTLIKRELMTVEEVLQTKEAIVLKSPNKPLKTRFIPHFDKDFPVQLERSGYRGRNVSFEDIMIFDGKALYDEIKKIQVVISTILGKDPKQMSIDDKNQNELLKLFATHQLPYTKEMVTNTLTEEMIREIELSLMDVDKNTAKEIIDNIRLTD